MFLTFSSKASMLLISHIWLLSSSIHLCAAWRLAADCARFSHVAEAMTSALNMSIYAKMRAANPPPRLGTSLVDLLGAPDEEDIDTLQFVQAWFQRAVDAARVPSPAGLLIHCSDEHLKPVIPELGRYIDLDSNAMVTAPRPRGPGVAANACGGVITAFSYPSTQGQVMILCSDSAAGALYPSIGASLESWRTAGTLKVVPAVVAKGVDALGLVLSTTIVHELMHVAGMSEQLTRPQLSQFPGILPDLHNGEKAGEFYQYSRISGKTIGSSTISGKPTTNNLRHNADSFALLAASWYLPGYAWIDGACKTVGIPRQPPLWYPGSETAPGPS